MDANPLTDEYARYGVFNVLADSAEAKVKEIVLNLGSSNPGKGTNAFKIWTLYSQGMDSVRRNAEGAAPILDDLKKIETTPHEGMEDLFMWMHKNYSSPFFGAGPMEDMADSRQYAMYVSGGSMGLGDRDYYLLNDKENRRILDAYKKLIVGPDDECRLQEKGRPAHHEECNQNRDSDSRLRPHPRGEPRHRGDV